MDKKKYWIIRLFFVLFTMSVSVAILPCGIINVHSLFGEITTYICFLASLGLKVTILFSVILNFLIFPVSESLNLYSNSSTHSLVRYKSIKQLKTKIQEDIY